MTTSRLYPKRRFDLFGAAVLTAALSIGVGCESKPDSKTSNEADAGAGIEVQSTDSPQPADSSPPPTRPALPLQLVESRLKSSSVGHVRIQGEDTDRVLRAIGLNLCNTGWALQGFIEGDDGLEVTPVLTLGMAEVPLEPAVYPPRSEGARIKIDAKRFSFGHVEAKIDLISPDDESALSFDINGVPIGVVNDAKAAMAGCYTTGAFKTGALEGPVSAVFDGALGYEARARLDQRHDLVVSLTVKPSSRTPQNVFRGDLARIFEKPETSPIRVFVERRVRPTKDENREIAFDRIPLKKGEIVGAFGANSPQGPIRWMLTDIEIPDWTGPLAGQTVEEFKLETAFATDSPIVPMPREPNWTMAAPDESDDPPE